MTTFLKTKKEGGKEWKEKKETTTDWYGRMKAKYPGLSVEDWEELLQSFFTVPSEHLDFVRERIYNCTVSYVYGEYFWIQNWHFPNVFNWKETPLSVPQHVACYDFPAAWAVPGMRPERIVGWREKKDGVAYIQVGNSWQGDESLEIPEKLKFIKSFERIGNDCYVLFPYLTGGIWVSGELTFRAHPWRKDPIVCEKEGVMLLMTDRKEYRLKRIPTTETVLDDEVMEVQIYARSKKNFQFDIELLPVRPRPNKKPKTRLEALDYLSRQVFFAQVRLSVEAEWDEMVPDHETVCVRGEGDIVKISLDGQDPQEDYTNTARVATSAKVLLQDPMGRIVLVKEGRKPWDFPGGKADYLEEPPSQIIRRECREEIGYELPPTVKWKLLRRTIASIGFIYHVVDDKQPLPENAAYFTIAEVLKLPIGETVTWLLPLLYDAVASGTVNILTQTPSNVLLLGKKGDKCQGATFECKEGTVDMLYNFLQDGKYTHDVVPVTQETKRVVPLSFAQVSDQVSQRVASMIIDKLGEVFPSGVSREYVVSLSVENHIKGDNSYFAQCNKNPSQVAFWNKPHRPVVMVLLMYDDYLYHFYGTNFPNIPLVIQQAISAELLTVRSPIVYFKYIKKKLQLEHVFYY